MKPTLLRKDDMVMVIAGGNGEKRPLKGATGKILGFVGQHQERALVQGLNKVTQHKRPTGPDSPGGKVEKEAAIHVSNLRYYAEKLKAPVRLRTRRLDDGRKVRGYMNPENQEFVQLES